MDEALKIIVVEDERLAAKMLENCLQMLGYKVLGIYDSSDSLLAGLSSFEPDIILMDISLKGDVDGVDTANIIHADKNYPIVFVTGQFDELVLSRINENISYGHVTKPVNIETLNVVIKSTLNKFKVHQQLLKSEKRLQLSTQILELLNQSENHEDVISDILFIIKKMVEYSAVAIRLKDGDGFPYYDAIGFSEEYREQLKGISFEKPSIFCQGALSDQCDTCFDVAVLEGNIDPSASHYTAGGSFWSNDIQSLLNNENREILEDYRSIAFIPLHSGVEIIGLLQFNCLKKDAFDLETIRFFERISSSLGLTISRKQTYEKLKVAYEKSNQLETIINRSPIVTFRWSLFEDWRVSYVSESIKVFGYNSFDFYSGKTTYRDLIFEEDIDTVEKNIIEFMGGDQQYYKHTYRIKTYAGKVRWVEDHTWKEIGENGEVASLQGLVLDITKRHFTHQRLLENTLFMDYIIKGIKAAIITIDMDSNRIIDINAESERLLCQSKEFVLEENNIDFFYTPDVVSEINQSSNIDGVIFNGEGLLELRSGSVVPVKKTIIQIQRDGVKNHIVVIFDISDQKELERQLTHAQKMESVGVLAAGVAHEINTPIQYVGDNTHFFKQSAVSLFSLLDKYTELKNNCNSCDTTTDLIKQINMIEEEEGLDFLREEVPVAIDQSIDGINQVTRIVRAMKNFTHPGQEDKSLTNINSILENTVTVTRNEWKYVADVKFVLEDELPLVPCLAGDIGQAVLNMIVNASHAIKDVVDTKKSKKGQITIKSGHDENYVFYKIKDTGSGMTEETKTKIFNPFFTTKDVGKGTGQGLSFVYSIIVETHKGKINVTSEVGKGTEFTVYLPIGES